MVSINQNAFTPTINAPTVAETATSTASGAVSGAPSATANVATNNAVMYTAYAPNTSDPDYSNVAKILEQSVKKVEQAKKDLDNAEAKWREASNNLKLYYDEACKKYGSNSMGWPLEVSCEVKQLEDLEQVYWNRVELLMLAYDSAVAADEKLTMELGGKMERGEEIPTSTGQVSSTVNAPTPTTPNVSPYPSTS